MKKLPEIKGITKEQLDTIFTINPSVEYLERAYDDIKYGRISVNPYVEVCIPSLTIPNYAPNGKHVLSATVQYVPYHLRSQKWDNKLKNQVIQNVTRVLEKYISDFSNIVENSSIISPVNLEESLGLYAPFDLEIDDYLFENT